MRPELTYINRKEFMTDSEILAEQVAGTLNHIRQKQAQGFNCMHLEHLPKQDVDFMKAQLDEIKKLGYKVKIEYR